MSRGRLLVGTSGFAYPAWAPRFYPAGVKGDALLPFYAGRLPAVELNNTFYARPTAAKIAAWVAATPPDFRFVVKAQRGAAVRALTSTPAASVEWLTEGLAGFGARLGAVLLRVPNNLHRRPELGSDAALRRLLAAWPASIPLVAEFQHGSWHLDETYAALREGGATLCATDLPDSDEAPTIRLTGRLVYLRLRRHDYGPDELQRWADRVGPFLDAGHDVYVFFRHDETGRGPELAQALAATVDAGQFRS
ncbi:MAG: DUF72 domain-containing protein [Chloroflexota bacterium]